MKERILSILGTFGNDAGRMMDILLGVQAEFGCVSDEAVSTIATALHISEVDVIQVRSFYHFFTCKPVGKYAVYLNNSVVSCMMGMDDVADEFEKLTGVSFGKTTADGQIGLRYTACIGMSDQEPAALINNVVFTSLTCEKVRQLVADMRPGKAVQDMVTT